jgi:trigger factor
MTLSDVSVLTESRPGSRVELTIEVPSVQIDAAFDKALDRLSRRVRVHGFRPGRAPRPLVEARVGVEALREEVADSLLPEVVGQALQDNQIEPLGRPTVSIHDLERGRPGRFRALVSVMPQVTLPTLEGLTREAAGEVDDQMVAERLEELRAQAADVVPVERPVAKGDEVIADVTTLVDDKAVDEQPALRMVVTEDPVEDGGLAKELIEALVGTSIGETASAMVNVPEDDENLELRGKRARVEAVIRGVKEKQAPELTDELAQTISDGKQTTVEELRKSVRGELEEGARRNAQENALRAVVEATEIEIPDVLIDFGVDREIERLEEALQRNGLSLSRYLGYMGRSEAAYRAELRPVAEGAAKTRLVLEALGKELTIDPTDAEVEAYAREDSSLGDEFEELWKVEGIPSVFRQRLVRLRILEVLVERMGVTPALEEGIVTEPASAVADDEGA